MSAKQTSTATATAGEPFLRFLLSLDGHAIPAAVQAAVAQHTLEILAGVFAGMRIDEMQPILRDCVRTERPSIAVIGTAIRSELGLAAGASAALAHAAELDPIHMQTVICPGAMTIPAALSVAQDRTVSGARFIAAVAGGYDVAVRLGRALNSPELLSLGWWPTAVCGSIAAAATAGICMAFSEATMRDALGLAAVHSGGLAIGGANTPVARNMLCAHAVRVGIDAALAAHTGVAGPRELFAGDRSFISAFSRSADPARLDAALGVSWSILETSLKRWPCALQAQTGLDALSSLSGKRGAPSNVLSVEVRLPLAMKRIVDRPNPPVTRLAAAASLQFLMAALLVDGDIEEWRLDEPARAEPRVLELMQRIHVIGDEALDARYPQEWAAHVTLSTSQGMSFAQSSLPPGHPSRPLASEASERRFRSHAARHLQQDQIDSSVAFIGRLREQPDVGELIRHLTP